MSSCVRQEAALWRSPQIWWTGGAPWVHVSIGMRPWGYGSWSALRVEMLRSWGAVRVGVSDTDGVMCEHVEV